VLSTTVDTFQQNTSPAVTQVSAGKTLTIDLRAARLVDSVGLNALVSVIKQVRAAGANVTVWVGHENVRRILAFTRIDTHAKVEGPIA
jgi:anti-anti-sigma factor